MARECHLILEIVCRKYKSTPRNKNLNLLKIYPDRKISLENGQSTEGK